MAQEERQANLATIKLMSTAEMAGSVAILNVGEGDVKLSFDQGKPEEAKRAKKIVTDMLARGYAILVHVGEKDGEPVYRRATKFDPKTNEYIIAGATDDQVPSVEQPRRKPGPRRVPAASTRAVAVSRSAGGYDPIIIARIRKANPAVLTARVEDLS